MELKTTLEELCINPKNRNERSSARPSPVVTNRAKFVMDKITEMNLTYILDSFLPSPAYGLSPMRDERGEYKFYNIIVKFSAQNSTEEEGVIFTAHHDINNSESENCQDNSASVVNLLRLCFYLKQKNDLKRNVYVVFTDCEEFGGKGAYRLSEQIHNREYGKISYIVNSELTAFGKHIWYEPGFEFSNLREKIEENLEEKNKKSCPFNDSYIFRGMRIDSICLGILPKEDDGRLATKNWGVCHSIYDTIEHANFEDMENYIQFLLKLI